MTKMILTRGLPGSGKSTWAENLVAQDSTYVRANRDSLRLMMYGKPVLSSTQETYVTVAQHGMVENALKAGLNVVVDDTNFFPRGVRNLLKIAQKYDTEVEFKDFTDVPVEVCIARDQARGIKGGAWVGYDVIQRMHDRYLKGRKLPLPPVVLDTYELKPYVERETGPRVFHKKPWAIIVDIDGTVAKMVDRGPYDWKRVGEDEPVEDVLKAVKALSEYGYEVLFTSGRDGSCFEETKAWLEANCDISGYGWKLLMRTAKDNRPDWIVKAEIFDKEIRNNYNVRCVFDDRNQVVSMWRKLGLTVMQVADGEF